MYLCDVMSISRTNCVDNSFNGIVGVDVGLTVGSAVCVAVSVGSTVVSGETVGSSVTCGVSVGAGDAVSANVFHTYLPLNCYKIIISH